MAQPQVINRINLNKIGPRARAAALTVMHQAARHWEGNAAKIIGRKHSDTGKLIDGVETKVFEEKRSLGINAYIAGSAKEYAQVIHDGRKVPAKQPPHNAIRAWVIRKLGISPDDPELGGITIAICRNIAKRGFKTIPRTGLQYFWNPLLENYKDYLKRIAAGIKYANRKTK